MQTLIGIDDTDNSEGGGTGRLGREIGQALEAQGLGRLQAVTRHQLLRSPQIAYTSRNSAICMVLENGTASMRAFVRDALRAGAAAGSNPGVVWATPEQIAPDLVSFGRRAKAEVLEAGAARELAQQRNLALESMGSSGTGVIGALAAIGLHHSGEDGRFVWLPGLRTISGSQTVESLVQVLGVHLATLAGDVPPPGARIRIGDWMRPVMRGGRATLIVEKEENNGRIIWRLADKLVVKAHSE